VLVNHLLHLDDQLPILRKPLLPGGNMVKQRLWAIVRIPNTAILEVPLDNPPIKGPGIPKQVVNEGLLKFPELGRGMLAQGIDEAIGVEHRQSFPIHLARIARFVVSHVFYLSWSQR
jgi:hypothetical protein